MKSMHHSHYDERGSALRILKPVEEKPDHYGFYSLLPRQPPFFLTDTALKMALKMWQAYGVSAFERDHSW
jgi:hypothetical protein